MVWERCVGYDTITFHSDPANFADLEEAKRTVYERLARELDAFYEIMQIRAAEMREWANAEEVYLVLNPVRECETASCVSSELQT
jgi:hypothetical protein